MKKNLFYAYALSPSALLLMGAGSPALVEVPLVSESHRHEPAFEAHEQYALKLGEGSTTLDVSCVNSEWFAEIRIGKRHYPRIKYSDLYGFGGTSVQEREHQNGWNVEL